MDFLGKFRAVEILLGGIESKGLIWTIDDCSQQLLGVTPTCPKEVVSWSVARAGDLISISL